MDSFQQKKNPLAGYFRQPKIYIKLPSQGHFYKQGSLDISENGEYAVYAMTAKDELIMKTPDALMNGQATVEVIKSCVPSILNPWDIPSIDVDAILIAIRIATYGEAMDVATSCPSCNHFNEYSLNLINYLDSFNNFNYEDQINVDPLIIHIRPYNYKEITRLAFRALEQEKIFSIVNDEEMSEEEKIEKFGSSFLKLTELTVDLITGCIAKIQTPDGEVDDIEFIKDFISNAPSDVFKTISEHVNKMKNKIELDTQEVECEECSHKFNISLTMDQSNFFAVRS
jgi:hypothetical protein